MDVGDARHSDEGEVVQDPADDGVEAGVVEAVELVRGEVVVATLEADEVVSGQGGEKQEGEGRGPVDEGITQEEVFDD